MKDLATLERIARSNGYWHHIEPFAARLAELGPKGYATWYDAAVDERVKRVAVEARLAEASALISSQGIRLMEADDVAARLAEAERDAARYRWLRAEHILVGPLMCVLVKYGMDRNSSDWVNVVSLDDAIDTAMASDSAS